MQTFLERYREGEYIKVCAELAGLGPLVRDEPWLSDAQAVAVEMVTRARYNVGLLIERLNTLGYRFIDPDRVWVSPDEKQLAMLNIMEKRYGPFPLVVRAWCEIVGSVNFMGAHPKLSKCANFDWGGSEKLDCYGDPLVVWTMSRTRPDLISYFINLVESDEEEAEMEEKMPPPFGLEIGLSAINKAGQSGGGGVYMLVPNAAFDAPLIDSDGYWTGTFFVQYLRDSFKRGGFPGLQGGWYPGQQWDPEYSRTEIEFLTKDLRPL
jgi:hypothetical protein